MLAVLASSYDFSISALREKCSDTEFFLGRIFPYSVRMWENTDQKNSVFGNFSRSVSIFF